jgi:hypothetical protein
LPEGYTDRNTRDPQFWDRRYSVDDKASSADRTEDVRKASTELKQTD